ncbi:cytochrome c oxidase subunit 3 family protein [Sporichthya brevicatena]|uniref:Cytochrome aa3 subunit 3 n=1 Tax=Sporichthya brevicatena TaxID=171442 RepID=A0ABN1GIG4_9ACTN
MTAEVEAPPQLAAPKGHVPGEPGLWVFLLGDMVVFGIFFGTILVLRGQEPEMFVASAETLHLEWGVANTIVLLTSSLFVVIGLHLARVRHHRAPMFFLAAVACGLVFAGVKAIEYTSLVRDGHTASVNDFYMYYFMFTGIHLGHVVLGMGALLVAMRISRPTLTGSPRVASLEGVASFWHLVDLLWIMLFATLYLVR